MGNVTGITEETPLDIFEMHYEEYPQSYKEIGSIGEKAYTGLFNKFIEGIIVDIQEGLRHIEAEGYVYIQKWIHGKYWLDFSCYKKEYYYNKDKYRGLYKM